MPLSLESPAPQLPVQQSSVAQAAVMLEMLLQRQPTWRCSQLPAQQRHLQGLASGSRAMLAASPGRREGMLDTPAAAAWSEPWLPAAGAAPQALAPPPERPGLPLPGSAAPAS